MATNCSFCGTEIKTGETVCSFCGTPVENATGTESAPTVVQEIVPAEDMVEGKEFQGQQAEEIPAEKIASPETQDATLPDLEKENLMPVASAGNSTEKNTEKLVSIEPIPETEPITEEKNSIETTSSSPENGTLRLLMDERIVYHCSGCGKSYETENKFCSDCGEKVERLIEEIPSNRAMKTIIEQRYICGNCGKQYNDLVKFCSDCGGKIEKKDVFSEIEVSVCIERKNRCLNCGKDFPDGIKFCSDCGGKIERKEVLTEVPCEQLMKVRGELVNTLSSWINKKQNAKDGTVSVENIADSQKCNHQVGGEGVIAQKTVDELLSELQKWKKTLPGDTPVYVSPNIPIEKLKAAVKSYAGRYGLASLSDVLLLIDSTAFGGAKEGMILTKDIVYYKNLMCDPQKRTLINTMHLCYIRRSLGFNSGGLGAAISRPYLGIKDTLVSPLISILQKYIEQIQ